MAWTTPSTWVAGAILTAAQLNTQLRDNILCGGPIYTTEALRDAAITSPFEGQRAYISGSTVAAATGSITSVPTGIQTIYNGTSWVCVTPVGASSTTSSTYSGSSYSTTMTGGDTTAISCTLTTGTTALVQFSCNASHSSTAGMRTTFSVSGATTLAAADANGSVVSVLSAGAAILIARSLIITGLTAGANTFTLNYNVAGGVATGTWSARSLIVQGIA
jgi:hypothetical protein